jgi:hypothetical protein
MWSRRPTPAATSTKKPRLEAKIDCATAIIMALGASFAAVESDYIYVDRDLLVF